MRFLKNEPQRHRGHREEKAKRKKKREYFFFSG
jgi:hypothetical protein